MSFFLKSPLLFKLVISTIQIPVRILNKLSPIPLGRYRIDDSQPLPDLAQALNLIVPSRLLAPHPHIDLVVSPSTTVPNSQVLIAIAVTLHRPPPLTIVSDHLQTLSPYMT